MYTSTAKEKKNLLDQFSFNDIASLFLSVIIKFNYYLITNH